MNHLNRTFAGVTDLSVRVKTAAAWQSYDTTRLQISVGQDYHESQALLATVNWVRKNFEKTIICVNDTLQRHNLEFSGLSSGEAFDRSSDAGREWIERNLPMIRALPNFEIIRWEQWREDPEYQGELDSVHELYRKDPIIREEIDQEVRNFWGRRQKQQSLSDEYGFARFQNHSREYLLEECAAFQLMFKRDEAADIYPGSTLIPCTLFKDGDAKIAKRRFTKIEFTRNKGNQPDNLSNRKVSAYG